MEITKRMGRAWPMDPWQRGITVYVVRGVDRVRLMLELERMRRPARKS